jgi:hypothetical protein
MSYHETDEDILDEIYAVCEVCPNQLKCLEDGCILYRVEQLIIKKG